jgi:hypothetical protein
VSRPYAIFKVLTEILDCGSRIISPIAWNSKNEKRMERREVKLPLEQTLWGSSPGW